MDHNISNINKITWIQPYNSKKGSQKKDKHKNGKKTDSRGAKDVDNIIDNKQEDVEHDDSENNNDVGHNIDIKI